MTVGWEECHKKQLPSVPMALLYAPAVTFVFKFIAAMCQMLHNVGTSGRKVRKDLKYWMSF